MSNPFRKTSALKRLLSILVLVAFSFTFSPVAMAQGDFDFSDDAGGDFDFSDDTPSKPLDLEKKFVMPNNGKPVNLVFVPAGKYSSMHASMVSLRWRYRSHSIL